MRGVDGQRAIRDLYDVVKSYDADMYKVQKQRSLIKIEAHLNPGC